MDPGDLINVIQHYPILWDSSRPDYHDKNLKIVSWNNIGKQIIKNWSSCSSLEKELNLVEIKKKWVNIRDYYKKHLHSQDVKRRKYIYHDSLSFLRPIYEKNIDFSENIKEEESSLDELFEETKTAVKKEVIEIDSLCNQDDENSSAPFDLPTVSTEEEVPITQTTKEPSLKLRAYKSNLIIDPLTTNNSRKYDREEVDDNDADLHFLKSLLPEMKKLTDMESLDLKIGILQLLKTIKNKSSM